MTDKKTISLIEDIAGKVEDLRIEQAKHKLMLQFILWIMGVILLALLPVFGFLISFWVQHGSN
jgi:hypothetical protein